MTTLEFFADGPESATRTVLLAHGAGQAMDSPFMTNFAAALAQASADTRVLRFEFPYMRDMRASGNRRAPDREAKLLECWREVVASECGAGALYIGGKSMGGRMASLVADELGVDGLICLGYPFHPPGKPEKLRTAHLADLATPALICQGERDTFGNRLEVDGYSLAQSIQLCWMPDGDHSFKPRKRSGFTESQNLARAAAACATFLKPV
jgi:uncharacterized protein